MNHLKLRMSDVIDVGANNDFKQVTWILFFSVDSNC